MGQNNFHHQNKCHNTLRYARVVSSKKQYEIAFRIAKAVGELQCIVVRFINKRRYRY